MAALSRGPDDCVQRTPGNERGRRRRELQGVWRTATTREMGAVTDADMLSALESVLEDVSLRMDHMEEKLQAISQSLDATIKIFLHTSKNMEINQAARTPDRKTPIGLSILVRRIHKNLGEQLQWKVRPTDHFRTEHNEEVTATVVQAVKDVEPKWSFHQVRRACNRAFESLKVRERMEREAARTMSRGGNS
ncbi:hypothetical protein OJAV_G00219720 [Oryzias javanicus]|uniref:Uncharacterized protein n=1 Tax=Oryzias javanicus TaxID=123683 RepID=A0A3S2NPN0_ORYJA|nr:hypothetical protein OJAV_G00219720 [Oryzias javanicus]